MNKMNDNQKKLWKALRGDVIQNCDSCKYRNLKGYQEPCFGCLDYCNWVWNYDNKD